MKSIRSRAAAWGLIAPVTVALDRAAAQQPESRTGTGRTGRPSLLAQPPPPARPTKPRVYRAPPPTPPAPGAGFSSEGEQPRFVQPERIERTIQVIETRRVIAAPIPSRWGDCPVGWDGCR